MNSYILGDIFTYLHPQDELRFSYLYQYATQPTEDGQLHPNEYVGLVNRIEYFVREDNLLKLKIMIKSHPEKFSWSNFLYLIGYYLKTDLFTYYKQSKSSKNSPFLIRKAPTKEVISWCSPEIDPTWPFKLIIQGVQASDQESLVPKLRIQMFKYCYTCE
jgi:hypothetical protein